jgi:hypothetical protein
VLGKIIDWCKYVARDPHATDGTETAVAALWGKVDASGGNPPAVSLVPVLPLSTATISSSPARRASQRLPPPMSRSRPRAAPLPLHPVVLRDATTPSKFDFGRRFGS